VEPYADLVDARTTSWGLRLFSGDDDIKWSPGAGCLVARLDAAKNEQTPLSWTAIPAKKMQLQVVGRPRHPSTPREAVSVTLIVNGDLEVITLTAYPDYAVTVNLEGLPENAVVEVRGEPDWSERPTLDLGSTVLRKLVIVNADVTINTPNTRGNGRIEVIDSVRCESGRLIAIGRTIEQCTVKENVTIEQRNGNIKHLKVVSGCRLTVSSGEPFHSVKPAEPAEPAESGTCARSKLTLASGQILVTKGISRIDLTLEDTAMHTDDAEDLMVNGRGTVVVRKSCQNICFGGAAISLSVGAYGQVYGATGCVRLERAAHAHIAGSPQGLWLEWVTADSKDIEGVSALNVAFPVSLVGIQTISMLSDHGNSITPLVHERLPGRDHRIWSRVAPKEPRIPANSGDDAVPPSLTTQLTIEAEYAHALADLAAFKGAPASVRTNLAWCSYRMRNVTAPGRTEHFVLSLYRMIGYGERVIPALICYAVVALMTTTISLHAADLSVTPAGIRLFLETWRNWLASPLHLLRLTDSITDSSLWQTLGRALVAIPFVTAVLALRNYVKDDHRTPK
jgi:hypothetical protein